jgi:glycosidase
VRRLLVLLAGALLLLAPLACNGDDSASDTTGPPGTTTAATTTVPAAAALPPSDLPWWNDRVFYEVFVRSFKDADGDGVGDLAGLTASLDYLNDGDPATSDDLGVTGLWLMPIFPSPSYHGYDVTDYRAINPDYGTMDDFTAFLDAAHDRGIAVLIDLVINHTSREHPWFVSSAAGDPAYADWYRWSDSNPGTVSPWGGGPVWHPSDGRYYYGLFWEGMPDLNLENPAVTAEVRDVARFWLDLGVDGFRLDGARHLIEEGDILADTPATVDWLEGFNDHVHTVAPDALVLGEVWSPTVTVAGYVPDALDLAFEFALSEAGTKALAAGDAAPFEGALATVLTAYPDLQWATFLTNHDMDRLMSSVGGDGRVARLAATWLLTSPGVPFLYYGEEVGLQGEKPDERIRTPMPWTAEGPGVGFTTGVPWEPADPGYPTANVAGQTSDPASLLSHYRTLARYRARSLALLRGTTVAVTSASPAITAFLRSEGDDHVLVVLNVSGDRAEVSLDLATGPLAGMQGVVPVVGPAAEAPEVTETGGFTGYQPWATLPPYGFLVLQLTAEPSPPPPPTTVPPVPTTGPATPDDVALVQTLLRAAAEGNVRALQARLAPDATLEMEGRSVPLATAIPDDAGVDASRDWDTDGTVTLRDVVLAQIAWSAVVATGTEMTCAPGGAAVVCEETQGDVFSEAAGLAPQEARWTVTVTDGLFQALAIDGPQEEPPAAWLEQFADYERWVSDTHPDVYPVVFRAPCCTGTPEGLAFTAASVEAQRTLVPAWVAQRASG